MTTEAAKNRTRRGRRPSRDSSMANPADDTRRNRSGNTAENSANGAGQSRTAQAEPTLKVTSRKLPQASRKNAEPDVAGRPTTPQYCLFYRDFRISHVPPPWEVGVACPRENPAVLERTTHRIRPGSGTTEDEPRTTGPSARTSAATGALHAVRTAVGERQREDYDQEAM